MSEGNQGFELTGNIAEATGTVAPQYQVTERSQQVYNLLYKTNADFTERWVPGPERILFMGSAMRILVPNDTFGAFLMQNDYKNVLMEAARNFGSCHILDYDVSEEIAKSLEKQIQQRHETTKPKTTRVNGRIPSLAYTRALKKLEIPDAIRGKAYVTSRCNRHAVGLTDKLMGCAREGRIPDRPVALVAPNNAGKSARLSSMANDLQDEKIPTAYVNVRDLSQYFKDHGGKSPDFSYVTQARLLLIDAVEAFVRFKKDANGYVTNQEDNRVKELCWDGTQRKIWELIRVAIKNNAGIVFAYSGEKGGWEELKEMMRIKGEEQHDEHYRHLAARFERAIDTQMSYPTKGEERVDFFREALFIHGNHSLRVPEGYERGTNDELERDITVIAEHLDAVTPIGSDLGKLVSQVVAVTSRASIEKKELNLDLTIDTLGGQIPLFRAREQEGQAMQREIEKLVCAYSGIQLGELRLETRGKQELAYARQLAMATTRVLRWLHEETVANLFNRNRATALHAYNTFTEGERKEELELVLDCVERSLRSKGFTPKRHPLIRDAQAEIKKRKRKKKGSSSNQMQLEL